MVNDTYNKVNLQFQKVHISDFVLTKAHSILIDKYESLGKDFKNIKREN